MCQQYIKISRPLLDFQKLIVVPSVMSTIPGGKNVQKTTRTVTFIMYSRVRFRARITKFAPNVNLGTLQNPIENGVD